MKSARKPRQPTLRRAMSILKKQMPDLAERYRVKSLGIFGSYVRNQQRPRSDMDLLVDFEKTPNLFELMDLEDHLARLLDVKVDLVTRQALRGEIGNRILNEVIPV